ncbi:energy transducer TonB [Pseudomonas sp. BN417]|nr:energy transducer TonB [Pseudomonas sp. BN417]
MLYPGPEMRQGEVGSTVLRVTIGRDGLIRSLKVTQSSGSVDLDNAALDAVWRARRFPPFAPGMVGDELVVNMPVQFDSQQNRVASPPREPSASDPTDAASTEGKAEELRAFLDTLRQGSVKPERLTYVEPRIRGPSTPRDPRHDVPRLAPRRQPERCRARQSRRRHTGAPPSRRA